MPATAHIQLHAFTNNEKRLRKATYMITHTTPGRDGTCLRAPVELLYLGHGSTEGVGAPSVPLWEARLALDHQIIKPSPKEALLKLAETLRRIADAIDAQAPAFPEGGMDLLFDSAPKELSR